MPAVQQDVLRLDVPVDDAVPVGVVEGAGDLGGYPDRIGDGELFLAIQPIPKALPLDERHHIEKEGIRRPRIEQRQDMRVLQVGGGLDLRQEAVGPDHRGELGAQHLDRNFAIVFQVLRQILSPCRPRPVLGQCGSGQRGPW